MSKPTGMDYYLARKSTLLKKHERLMSIGATLFRSLYGETFTYHVLEQTQVEFEKLIPQIPYIGGDDNPLTDTMEQMTSLLALYRVLRREGKPLDEIGELVHEMARQQVKQYPRFLRHLLGRLYMSRLWRQRTAKKAVASQKQVYPDNFVYEVVDGNGHDFEWGIDYLECGIVKFFNSQSADEFTPYMCYVDHLMFPAMGIDLERSGTIAHGCSHCDFRFKRQSN